MIDILKKLLSENSNLSGWKIIEKSIESKELFFIKQELDMNRTKTVTKYHLTIYKDFEEDGEKYRGSANTLISPTMDEAEIEKKIEDSAFAASFVKNKWYPIADSKSKKISEPTSNLAKSDFTQVLPNFIKAIFENDIDEKSFLNSSELFLEKHSVRIVNSNSLDVSYIKSKGLLELVAQSNLGSEEVELFRIVEFSDTDYEYIKQEVKELIDQTRDRSITESIPTQKELPIILSGESVKGFLEYYITHSNAKNVYDGISRAKIDKPIHEDEIVGDKISLTIIPNLYNSSESAPFDSDGYTLKDTVILDEGIVKNYIAPLRYGTYLDCDITGSVSNFEVKAGYKPVSELKKEPYLEAIAFSDFQMEPMSGDFGGEIRLGIWFDGKNYKKVSGCSITGNIHKSALDMRLSKETKQINNYKGPSYIKLKNINIAGS